MDRQSACRLWAISSKISTPGNLIYPPANTQLVGDDGSRGVIDDQVLDFRNEQVKNPPVSEFWVVDPRSLNIPAL